MNSTSVSPFLSFFLSLSHSLTLSHSLSLFLVLTLSFSLSFCNFLFASLLPSLFSLPLPSYSLTHLAFHILLPFIFILVFFILSIFYHILILSQPFLFTALITKHRFFKCIFLIRIRCS